MTSISKSFSSKLSLTVLLLAVPVFFLSLDLLFIQSRRMIHDEAIGRANSALNATMQRVHSFITTIETATDANSTFITEQLNPEALLDLTRYVVMINSNIDGCSISMEPDMFPEYGRYFSAYSIRQRKAGVADSIAAVNPFLADTIITVVEEPYEYFQKAWYKRAHDTDATCWVDFYDETDSLEVALNGMIASFCRPIHDNRDSLVAIISTDISLNRLSKSITQEKPYPNAYFMMVNSVGQYIVHPDSTRLFTKSIYDDAEDRHQPGLISLGHAMARGETGRMLLSLDGVLSLITYQQVPGTAWSLALVCPESDILMGYHQMVLLLVPLLLAGLVFIVLLCRHVGAHAMRPLNTLLEKTQHITAGDIAIHIAHSPRTDVIGQLQNSFASMLQSLNFHMGSVRYTTLQAQERNEELAEATRLAEKADRQKTEFIQNVSHQIRTPLNIIMGFSQILNNTANIPEEERNEISTTMDHNSRLLHRMLVMLFDSSDSGFFEEQNSNRQERVGCNDLGRDTISNIADQYPGITIGFKTDVADDYCMRTNRLYLMRSLRELLHNSAKYSDGQHVTLCVEGEEGLVRFIVEDTGKGIAADERERMFTFFAKENDLSEGLGLGLPLTKRHILNLGGELTIDNNYNEGCRFIVTLPLQPQ